MISAKCCSKNTGKRTDVPPSEKAVRDTGIIPQIPGALLTAITKRRPHSGIIPNIAYGFSCERNSLHFCNRCRNAGKTQSMRDHYRKDERKQAGQGITVEWMAFEIARGMSAQGADQRITFAYHYHHALLAMK